MVVEIRLDKPTGVCISEFIVFTKTAVWTMCETRGTELCANSRCAVQVSGKQRLLRSLHNQTFEL